MAAATTAAWSRSRSRRGRQGARAQAETQTQAGDGGLSPPTAPAAPSHCRGCLSRAVPEAGLGLGLGLGLACPLCRHTDTDSSRAAAPLWQRGRRRKQDRRRQEEEAEQRPEPGRVFRAPLVLSKAGEVRDEFESRLRQYEAERESLKEDDETVTAEIIQIILAEGEQEKQQMEKAAIAEQVKKDEELARKWSREFAADNMSDSENEEPVKHMSTRQRGSTANSKLSSNSSGRITSMLGANSEKNRSWSTPVENNQNRRTTPRSDSGTKTASVTTSSLSTNTLINILSSSENSRSNSAPDLSSEKRTLSDPSLSGPVKRERSVSPDSNDSISGELNHFKPIICSPCTPPKKLPDGRLLKPKIVKSTPRNLGYSLQKMTTYDVNPSILAKWGQILRDRRKEKTVSKATLTLEEEEEEETTTGRPMSGSDFSGLAPPDDSGSRGSPEAGRSDPLSPSLPMDCSASAEVPDTTMEDLEWEAVDCQAGGTEQENGPQQDPKGPARSGKKRRKGAGATGSTATGGGGGVASSSRSHRGKKRFRKTKHTTPGGQTKRVKWNAAGNSGVPDPASHTDLDRARQEEEDRKLAFRLQRRFDLERTTVNRKKGSEESYLLRTTVTSNTK
ncbi:E3 ubiquitin-protein ligase RNF169 [Heptranchias perlo]|uniref:E3 ubiquitin-protein ligase RNF169 n=1 Tax=Heptranchias perlo TaxID=212740 RepID=UPI0035598EF9